MPRNYSNLFPRYSPKPLFLVFREFQMNLTSHSFLPRSDSEAQISQMAFQSLIELCEIWPNVWISKEVFDECLYSILSQVCIRSRYFSWMKFSFSSRRTSLISIIPFVSSELCSITTNWKKNPFDIMFIIY